MHGVALMCALTLAQAGSTTDEAVHRYIQAAAALYRSLDNERALEQLNQAQALPHTVDDSVQILLYEALILSDEGRHQESDDAFRAAFALEPDVALPVPVSPKVDARVRRLRAATQRALRRVAPAARPATEAPAPALAAAAPPPSGLSPWLPAAAGVTLLAAAGGFALLEQGVEQRLRSDLPPITSRAQLDAVTQEGRVYEVVGWALAGAGAAGLGVAAVLHWRRPPVAVVGVRGGAAAVLCGSFP